MNPIIANSSNGLFYLRESPFPDPLLSLHLNAQTVAHLPYLFNPRLLGQAHEWNRLRCQEALKRRGKLYGERQIDV